MKRLILIPPTVLLGLLLHAALATGEERDPLTYLRADETIPVAMISGAVDAWTALDLQERSAIFEINPLAQTSAKTVAIQFASVGGHIYLSHAIDRRFGRKWGKRTLWGIAVIKFAVAGSQLAQGRKIKIKK